jgi:hypothetical protein
VVARPCEVSWELAFSGIVYVAPLWLEGFRGKKSTPSVGWEVLVRSQQLASRIWTEREHKTTIVYPSPSLKVRMPNFASVIS